MSRPRKPFGANHPGRLPATMMKVLAAEMSDPSRLRRGKQYAKDGSVLDIIIEAIEAAGYKPGEEIAIALDVHTNLTEEMVNNSPIIDGYRTYPHIDMYETGKRAAESLFRIIDQGLSTRICWRALPMMTHMIKQTPSKQPMKENYLLKGYLDYKIF